MGNKSGKGKSGDKKSNLKNDFTPEEKAKYMETYGMTESTYDQIKADWKLFSRDGKLHKFAFIGDMRNLMSQVDDTFLERMFNSFDTDDSGYIGFEEYFECRGVVHGGSLDVKLAASFRLFDMDGNGELEKDEIIKMLQLFTFAVVRKTLVDQIGADRARMMPLELDQEAIEKTKSMTDKIFEIADKDKSGTITLEEFKAGLQEDPSIMGFFKQF